MTTVRRGEVMLGLVGTPSLALTPARSNKTVRGTADSLGADDGYFFGAGLNGFAGPSGCSGVSLARPGTSNGGFGGGAGSVAGAGA